MPPQFYNLRDQAIYSAGDFFIPQERYRAAPYNVNTPAQDDPAAAGIPAIYQSQGGGGGGTYTGGISDLTGDFFKTTSDRQNRLTELNRPLAEAQFPSFPGPRTPGGFDAQAMYNKASADLNDPFNRLATTETFSGTRPAIDVMNYADDIIDDYRMQYATGQLGPSFIPAEKPTLNRRIQDAFYSLPFLSKPQSADQIIAEGYTGQSNMPGIMSMVLGSMDKYGKLPRGDQAFIARNMGYTGPTVFGENTTGGAKDPFGLNVRSGFGNYAEAVEKQVNRLDDYFGGEKFDKKYGEGTTLEFDEETGQFRFVGTNAAEANRMNKMNLARYNFYKKQVEQRDADRKAAEEAEKAAAAAAAAERNRVAQVQSRLDSGTYVDRDDSGLSASDRAVGGGAKGRAANIDNDRSTGTSQGYTQHYMDGGIVDMLEIYD